MLLKSKKGYVTSIRRVGKDFPLKVASKLSLGVDLSLTILLLHTKSKALFSLICELPFTFINKDFGALFPTWRDYSNVSEWLAWLLASKIQGKFKAMTILSFSPLVSLNTPWWLWSFSSKNLLFFYSVHWSQAWEYESILQGPQKQ